QLVRSVKESPADLLGGAGAEGQLLGLVKVACLVLLLGLLENGPRIRSGRGLGDIGGHVGLAALAHADLGEDFLRRLFPPVLLHTDVAFSASWASISAVSRSPRVRAVRAAVR